MDAYRVFIDYLKSKDHVNRQEFNKFKKKVAKEYSLKKIPSNIEILMHSDVDEFEDLKKKIPTKPIRTLAGVSVVAIMSIPHNCPHGKCITCPGGVASFYGDVPQSYTGHEPATLRAIRNDYDPYLQVFNRLEQYIALGKEVQKVELIIMGGTFSALNKDYQNEFISYAFKAMNDFSKLFINSDGTIKFGKYKEFFEMPSDINDPDRARRLKEKIYELKKSDFYSEFDFKPGYILNKSPSKAYLAMKKQHQINEFDSDVKCVALCLETRPDYGYKNHGQVMLDQGVTRVELGVQSVYDDVLDLMKRGHGTKESIRSIKELKDLGFKINAHYMPGLYGSSYDKDLEGLKTLISDSRYMPDMLKVYPTMVMKGTELYGLYEKEKDVSDGFRPMDTQTAINLMLEFKPNVPKWLRIMRVQRDIPSKNVFLGVDRTNLRQMIHNEMKKKDISCNCIRCRQPPENYSYTDEDIKLEIIEYDASSGKEYFISYEDVVKNKILGYIRLRFPSLQSEFVGEKTALIRELHVYGSNTLLKKKGEIQHKGFGKKLLKKAEEIAKENGFDSLNVISGIGVRQYYRKLGYELYGPYMRKKLS